MKLAALVLAVLLAPPAPARAYTPILRSAGGTLVPLLWPAESQPVVFELHDSTGPALPNITDDSDPAAAVRRALGRWPAISAVRLLAGPGSGASGGQDGRNVVSFADTEDNREIFEMAGDAIALTLYFFDDDARLTESDILFNPDVSFSTTARSQEELEAADLADVEGVATHELGHAIGLDHSGVESASMWALASLAQRQLDEDDVAGARALYPNEFNCGRIVGHMRVGSRNAFGVQMVALNSAGVPTSTLTRSDGTYAIECLPADSYQLYAEPLDGPHGSEPDDNCTVFGNMSESGIYGGRGLTTNFQTTLAGALEPFTVTAGQTTTRDFAVDDERPTINPVLVGNSDFIAGTPLAIRAGTIGYISLAGVGLDQVNRVEVSGSDIEIDSSSIQRMTLTCQDRSVPGFRVSAAVAETASSGGRTLKLCSDNECAALTGGLRVVAECTGDCDGDRQVSVAELIRGVNVALGSGNLDECTAIDRDNDDVVTVSELVLAVNAALSGCP